MTTDDAELNEIIAALAQTQKQPLSILKLSNETYPTNDAGTTTRTSDVSEQLDNPSPSLLEAELKYYKEHFSKLRFSYLEQVTKEHFLGSITDDPPELVEQEDIIELEKEVAESKKALQASKAQVKAIFEEIEAIGKRVCDEYAKVNHQTSLVLSLPASIDSLEAEIASLMHLPPPLAETRTALSAAENELIQIQRRIDNANRAIPGKQRKLEALDRELKPLEENKLGVVGDAEEAVKRREEERQRGLADRENAGRWYKASGEGLEKLVGE